MTTPRQLAEAFSGHRFREVYPALAPDVRWTSVGDGTLTGPEAVVDACEATLGELASGTAEFERFVVIADGATSVVSSCDNFAFRDGAISSITSYTVELDPGDVP